MDYLNSVGNHDFLQPGTPRECFPLYFAKTGTYGKVFEIVAGVHRSRLHFSHTVRDCHHLKSQTTRECLTADHGDAFRNGDRGHRNVEVEGIGPDGGHPVFIISVHYCRWYHNVTRRIDIAAHFTSLFIFGKHSVIQTHI